MPYLTKQDLDSHIYGEIIGQITRDNDTIVTDQIEAAISEAKAYLRKYDVDILFGGTIEDKNLENKIKDVACWNIVKLANPNIDMNLFKGLYDDAIKFFDKIMKGQADPYGWPYATVTQDTPTPTDSSLITDVDGNVVRWSSNTKRQNHY